MYNFHFWKVIAGVGPLLAKETILSKIVNMVDVFKISLSQWFDDNNKKYIETILKLDNSKTIMMETRGADLRIKNVVPVSLKKWQEITIDYSEYAQESDLKLYVDYPRMHELPTGTKITLAQSEITLEVKDIKNEEAVCTVIQGWTVIPYDKIIFQNYDPQVQFLTDRDKKELQRGLAHGIHIVAASYVKSAEDINHLRAFLSTENQEKMKIYAKIETPEALDNFDDILSVSDGVIIAFDTLAQAMKDQDTSDEKIITHCKKIWKPIIAHYAQWVQSSTYPLLQKELIQKYCHHSVDGCMIETMIQEEDPLRVVNGLFDAIQEYALEPTDAQVPVFYKGSDFIIRDYIIYNAYRICSELEIKAIVCYTYNGYTTARLAALHPRVPIIAFTSVDETYRYINTLWWVKWFKISPNFNYENLKRIGKEMIRIIFKGNISLDDKIIIVQANEIARDEKTDMINGVELYKFKNI